MCCDTNYLVHTTLRNKLMSQWSIFYNYVVIISDWSDATYTALYCVNMPLQFNLRLKLFNELINR